MGLPVTPRMESAAPPRTVHLGHDDAGDAEAVVEALGDGDRFLPGHGVGHEEDLRGLHGVADAVALLHEGLVDLETAGRVDDEAPMLGLPCPLLRRARRLDGVAAELAGIHLGADLLAQRLELLDGRGSLEIARRQHGHAALAAETARQLGRRRRLPGALESHHEDHGGSRGGLLQRRTSLAEEVGQLVVDDLDDLLAGRDGLQHLLAQGPLLDTGKELAGHLEVDVGLQEDASDLTEALLHHRLRENTPLAQLLQRFVELVTEFFEHVERSFGGWMDGGGLAGGRGGAPTPPTGHGPRKLTRRDGSSRNGTLTREWHQLCHTK